MTKCKRVLIFLLLGALSAAAVFVPQQINAYGVNRRLTHTEYWQHSGSAAAALTAEEVARLYGSTDMLGGSMTSVFAENAGTNAEDESVQDEQAVRRAAKKLIGDLFAEDNGTGKWLSEIADAECVFCDRSYIVSLQNGTASVLSFVSVSFGRKLDVGLDLTYEEKTGTLVRLLLYGMPQVVPEEVFLGTVDALHDYFRGTLHLDSDKSEYVCRFALSNDDYSASYAEAYLLSEKERETWEAIRE